jgi:hypothetical protein
MGDSLSVQLRRPSLRQAKRSRRLVPGSAGVADVQLLIFRQELIDDRNFQSRRTADL